MSWCALAGWQYHEYRHECEAARETLRRQAESVTNALVSGLRSHRRLGQYFEEQVQGVLDELVQSQDVLAAAVTSFPGPMYLAAGRVEELPRPPEVTVGESWLSAGYRMVTDFRLPTGTAGGGGGGPGRGAGFGGGRGRGFGARWQGESEPPTSFAADGQYAAILLLDRTRADEQCRRAAWSRFFAAAAGSLLLLCLALVWRTTVRLAAAQGALEAETRHLQELNQAAAGLAHETRNPLGLIRGWAQRLAGTDLGPAEQQQAQSLVEECDRVTSRINQFLAFARPREPRVELVQPEEIAAELAGLLEPDLSARRLTLQRAMPASAAALVADRDMLRQVLFNLLQNAVQWSPEGGTIEISLRRGHSGRWRVEVADQGPGVSAEAVDRLFTPYFTTRAEGTGLGLAIVRRIATAHGWEVGFTPRPGDGAIFWVDGIHG